jgi:predicted acetylornithine/succinylornithine family transaminase
MSKNKTVIERHDRFMTHNYPRYPIAIAQGSGSRVTDERGRTYLDLFAGFGAGILGHCHDDLVAAGTKQMTRLWHVGNLLHTEPQTTLAEAIAERAFGGKSFFCHSGSDANEAAFKIARLHGEGERHKIIATHGSFHGRGFAAMVATGQKAVSEGFAPLLPGFEHVPFNDLEAMKQAIDEETVAIIVEPIQGEGGVIVPDDDYLPGLRRLADEHDLVLIFDEVWTGCGRTGQWFAYQHWDTPPDVMTLGKAVGGGLPLGVTHVSDKFAPLFDAKKMGRVTHATTLGGNCVTAAVSARLLEVIERDGLLERARQVGEQIRTRLNKLAERHESVVGVRGRGLFIGMELNPEADRAWFDSGAEVVKACLDRGVMINVSQGKVLRLAPPLTISDEEVNEGLSVIEDVIAGHQE